MSKRVGADRHYFGDADLVGHALGGFEHSPEAGVFGFERAIALEARTGQQAFGPESAVLELEIVTVGHRVIDPMPQRDGRADNDPQRVNRGADGASRGVQMIVPVIENQDDDAQAEQKQEAEAQRRRAWRMVLIVRSGSH